MAVIYSKSLKGGKLLWVARRNGHVVARAESEEEVKAKLSPVKEAVKESKKPVESKVEKKGSWKALWKK